MNDHAQMTARTAKPAKPSMDGKVLRREFCPRIHCRHLMAEVIINTSFVAAGNRRW